MVVFLELFQETNWSILKLEVTVLRPKNLLSQKINGNIIRNGNIRRFFRVTIQPWTLKMKRLFRNENLAILSVVTYWSEIDLAPIPVSRMLLNVFIGEFLIKATIYRALKFLLLCSKYVLHFTWSILFTYQKQQLAKWSF